MKTISAETFRAAPADGRSGSQCRSGGRAVIARAFTLVEILISVAALALIAVGLATIFGAIGRTVTSGKSVSAFTSYAALIERRMRADFEAMSRDFPLVIRNELAYDDGKTPVPLYAGDLGARPRRVDEIIFGIKDEVASAREPLYPGFTARGDSARIYYGHGQRRIENLNQGSDYLVPRLDDPNNDPAAALGSPDSRNPNRLAGEWMLLRHVTVMAGPSTTDSVMPPPASGLDTFLDNDVQVGLQPAASSPFRKLSIVTPDALPPPPPYNQLIRGQVWPQFAGGLVDATTSDFSEVRSIVTTAQRRPLDVNSEQDLRDALLLGSFDTSTLNALDRMHEWMDELFPTWSMASQASDRVRMRYEPAAPDYFRALLQQGPYNSNINSAWGRADHVMLSSSNFLPRCSEFIVEWSFGKVYTPLNPGSPGWDAARSGTPVWHGMNRSVAGQQVAHPYEHFNPNLIDEFRLGYRRLDGALGEYVVTTRRIHGLPSPDPLRPVTSYFGYVDPQFTPDRDGNGLLTDAADAYAPSLPWAWPELIRITISLADPNDPTVEQTFQFVFDAPGTPKESRLFGDP